MWDDLMSRIVGGPVDDGTHMPFLWAVVFPTSSLAGLANLVRSNRPLTPRLVIAALLNAGLFGVAIGAVLRHKYGADYDLMTLGIAILAGLGGNALLDFTVEMFKHLLKTEPLTLVHVIERIEKQFAGPGTPFKGDYSDASQQVII
jgi:hypothetical protein